MRDAREIGDKRNRIAAFVARGEVGPATVVAVDLERSEMAIGAAWIERTISAPTRLPPGRMRASTAGKAASAAVLIARKLMARGGNAGPGFAFEARSFAALKEVPDRGPVSRCRLKQGSIGRLFIPGRIPGVGVDHSLDFAADQFGDDCRVKGVEFPAFAPYFSA